MARGNQDQGQGQSVLPLHSNSLRHSSQPQFQSSSDQQYQQQQHHHHHHRPHLPHHGSKRVRRRANLSKVGVPNFYRNEAIAFVAELSGTFMFLFFAFVGTQVANDAAEATTNDAMNANSSITQAPNATTLQYIALSFGFSLAVNVWIFFRISGGLFNPAVTLALYLIKAIKPVRAISCFLAQIIGAIAASAVVDGILPGTLNIATALGPNVSIARGLFLEMFLTCELVLAILFLAAEKHKATFLAPVGIGLALFIAEMAGVFFTGGSLNPARSFGPDVILGTFTGYHWIYWLGPLLGSLLATGFYKLMKYSDYETVNPGQDFNEEETEHFKPAEDAETADDVRRPNAGALAAQDAIAQATQEAVQATVQQAVVKATEDAVRDLSPAVARGRSAGARTLERKAEREGSEISPVVSEEGTEQSKTEMGTREIRNSQASTLEPDLEKMAGL